MRRALTKIAQMTMRKIDFEAEERGDLIKTYA